MGLSVPPKLLYKTGCNGHSRGGQGAGCVSPPCCLAVRVFISTQSIRAVRIEETNAFMTLKGTGDPFSLRFYSSFMTMSVSPPQPPSLQVASFPIWLQGSGNWGNVRRHPPKGGDRCPSVDEWMNKRRSIHTAEYHQTIKRRKALRQHTMGGTNSAE